MPKKSTRNVRVSRIGKKLIEGCKISSSDVIVKPFRSIHVSVKNAKRWFLLKKRLALITDDELAAYLLDLAEPIIRRDGKCSSPGNWKTDQDKENDLEAVKIDDRDLLNVEEPLRRSPRKQCIIPAVTPELAVVVGSTDFGKSPQTTRSENVEPKDDESHVEKRHSRIKHHHKTREKHHRDKRAKRKHSKNLIDDEKNGSSRSDDRTSVLSSGVSVDTREPDIPLKNHEPCLPVVPKLIVERVSINDKEPRVDSTNDPQENSPLVENLNKNKRREGAGVGDRLVTTRSGETSRVNNGVEKTLNSLENYAYENSNEAFSNAGDDSDDKSNDKFPSLVAKRSENPDKRDIVKEEIPPVVLTRRKTIDEKKGKKRRKHGKQDSSLEKAQTTVEGDEITTVTSVIKETVVHKRRKKKHRRASSTTRKAKKFHDVRKAPQNGIVESASIVEEPATQTEITDETIADSFVNDTNGIGQSSVKPEGLSTGDFPEPQRLAIKIQLCQDCNNRHIKDSCPLILTNQRVLDRLSYENWLTRHKHNVDLTKAVAVEDPMSEGYAITTEDNFDSDDESAEPSKSNRTKVESEHKQLHVSEDRPLYARESLPECFQLKISNQDHGIGIYARNILPVYSKLGPLVGTPIKEMDIPDDFSMRHIWEIDNDGTTSYISTTNPLKSNWIRYMRPADTKDDRNVTAVAQNGELYLVTTQIITKGMELTYWADSQSSAWTRKNKVDKTNCGGCNLNFTHPIYYRLHCCIFHDTRYSLTIRKYHCKVCGAAVLGKDNIMKHAADLHGGRGAYQCQYCRKFFLRLNYLEMHRTYGCSQNPQRTRPLCDFCGRKFCQPQKLKVHIKRMHSDMSEVLREFQCKMCMKLLGSRAALQRHMKEVHHKDVVGAATCDRCGKMFQNKSNLKIHMLTHSGVKPFKCKENDCKAAFTTKQCLQFHYKKVHGLSEDMMPKIERSVAYTFDAYSGGLVEDVENEKTSGSCRRDSQENSNSAMSMDDCSSEHSSRADVSIGSFQPTITEFDSGSALSTSRYNLDRCILDSGEQETDIQERDVQDTDLQEHEKQDREMLPQHEMQDRRFDDAGIYKREIQEHEMYKREIHEHVIYKRESQENEVYKREIQEHEVREPKVQDHDIPDRELQDNAIEETAQSPIPPHCRQDNEISPTESALEIERPSPEIDFYGTRLPSKGSKKWMGQLSSLVEPEITPQVLQHHQHQEQQHDSSRSDVYEFEETCVKKDDVGNDTVTSSHPLLSSKLALNIYRRPASTNASLLVEAALDAAERDIGAVTSSMIDDNDRDTNLYTISNQLQSRQTDGHLESYIQQQDELMSPSPVTQDGRKTPTSHMQIDYHLHRPVDYINSPRTHSIEQYLPQDDLSRVGSPGYSIHMQQDDMPSPSSTPNQNRYQEIHHHHQQQQQHHHHHHQQQQQQQQQQQEEQQQQQENRHHHHHHHHQVPTDNLSSDEGDSVAQNLSISVKEKSLQLDLSTSYKYEQLDTEFGRERTNFGPIVLNSGELQGLDMSARGFHHTLGSNARYHHHLYEITERQSVDLSRTTGYSISPPPSSVPPPPPPPYPHSEVLRIVSLDLTPGHSVDLSLSRSHHLHSSSTRVITCSPQPPGSSATHVVPDTVEGRILSSPPPSITGYNATYPVSPAAYHPPRPGYHHYSGYY